MNEETAVSTDHARDSSAHADAVGQLIAQAGRRSAPTELATQQVYAAVHAEWQLQQSHSQLQSSRRSWRTWQFSLSLAATVLLAVLIGFWGWRSSIDSSAGSSAGVIAQVHGAVVRIDSSGRELPVALGATWLRSEQLSTAGGGNVLLRRPSGLTVLLGPNTRAKWEGADALRLISGILYVDSGQSDGESGRGHRDEHRDELVVLTHAGRIQHVGTQFSVDARTAQIRVAVREGDVRVSTSKGDAQLMRGEEARIAESGDLKLQELTAGLGPWTWLAVSQPQFAIENRPLSDVVRDIADASGLRVSFGTPELKRQAQQWILHGPALQLDPVAALDAVLLTTQMRTNREGDAIQIVLL